MTLIQVLVDSPWFWPVIFVLAGLDAVFPFMPSETAVVTAAVLIGPDADRLGLLTVLAALGALTGDVGGHLLGRRTGPRLAARLLPGERGRERLERARGLVERHAATLIVAGRFVPAGRAVSALATGGTGFPLRRFAALDAIGTSVSAVLAVALGALGGAAFTERPVYGLLASFGAATLISVAVGYVRRSRARWPKDGRRELVDCTFVPDP
ncbi:DedA family protein [Streptomyces sp. E11-3]|uniref:DedA family protein n=1 Tax=Streptomyces sp. E11-3 TaxID=3110112 RepID=UPI003981267B